ncbi:DUF2730 family protein [Methylobrevis pamukkalensis]|uniref:DUF2730 family protein n=1 Tax=Methylobrevis pamukkalensis TaxID=1439726 RepID=A0A1E3H4D7_9HYPH|nr:DUF2730 family protein [Methylobrevis pamukkalensis]ODN71189.1 hypothetical protein A6302_01478 [Methylobrevis pamukkalensis]
MEALKEYWPIITAVATILLGAAGWAIRMGLASKADLAAEAAARALHQHEFEQRMEASLSGVRAGQHELASRTLRIETEIKHLPTSEDISALRDQVSQISATATATNRELQSINHSLNRLEDHLYSRKP